LTKNNNIQSPVILFDGVCNLCSGTVQFIINKDKKNVFKFASLQSELGQQILNSQKLSTTAFNSFILYQDGQIYSRSTGALKVAGQLSGGWKLLSALLFIPAFLRDAVYNTISRNRYKWFGQKTSCWIPTPELRSKFLDM